MRKGGGGEREGGKRKGETTEMGEGGEEGGRRGVEKRGIS